MPTQLIVVIPCYNEPEVMQTIESLFSCDRGNFGVEIILLVNSYQITPVLIQEINRESYSQAMKYAFANNQCDFFLTPLLVEDLPGHQTGAGLPRKLGMDRAVAHFKDIDNKAGIIVSLDADCTVASNYLVEIYRNFKRYKLRSATIEFHHPIEHLPESSNLKKATLLYEDYLRYYRAALEYCGYPDAYYTIGSAFAVTADTYVQVGGMGKQQAGEDFYFLHKVFPLGKTRFIDTTCVYPAARTSDRVPFGTGPALAKMMDDGDPVKYTYQVESFRILKSFFDKIDFFHKSSVGEIENQIQDLPDFLLAFLKEDDFMGKVQEISQHTANIPSFRKRFFRYFNAFKILKYLNYAHPAYFPLCDVQEQYRILQSLMRN